MDARFDWLLFTVSIWLRLGLLWCLRRLKSFISNALFYELYEAIPNDVRIAFVTLRWWELRNSIYWTERVERVCVLWKISYAVSFDGYLMFGSLQDSSRFDVQNNTNEYGPHDGIRESDRLGAWRYYRRIVCVHGEINRHAYKMRWNIRAITPNQIDQTKRVLHFRDLTIICITLLLFRV